MTESSTRPLARALHPPLGTPEFARWLNGRLTRFCGHGFHNDCKGVIRTIGIECPCLCECHEEGQA